MQCDILLIVMGTVEAPEIKLSVVLGRPEMSWHELIGMDIRAGKGDLGVLSPESFFCF